MNSSLINPEGFLYRSEYREPTTNLTSRRGEDRREVGDHEKNVQQRMKKKEQKKMINNEGINLYHGATFCGLTLTVCSFSPRLFAPCIDASSSSIHPSNVRLERSTDQVIKPINIEALSKWVGQIPEDVVKDMAIIAPMLANLGYDPDGNPPDYGKPDSFVVRKMEEMDRNREMWQEKEKEMLKMREAIRSNLLKERDQNPPEKDNEIPVADPAKEHFPPEPNSS